MNIKKVFSEKTFGVLLQKTFQHILIAKKRDGRDIFFRSESLLCAHYIHGLTRQKMTFDHIDGKKNAGFSNIQLFSFEIGH